MRDRAGRGPRRFAVRWGTTDGIPWVNVVSRQGVALAEQASGQDLGAFFGAWLETPERPAPTAADGP